MTDGKDLLGIDLGTSSVKVLLYCSDGTTLKSRAAYAEESVDGWWHAIREALSQLPLSDVGAVGFSSQTGTYIVNGSDVIGWRSGVGRDELREVTARYDRETFLREISMPHPPLVSYPIPRLRYMKKHYGTLTSVCQPKDAIIARLTGEVVSDLYTWRGLANLSTGQYSAYFLGELGVDASILPPLRLPTERAGAVTATAATETGLPFGTPVYLGMNDFFASIVGMGITEDGMFDITGTSEHLGVVGGTLSVDTPLMSGPYFDHFVTYGVTASSGISLDYLRDVLGDLPRGAQDPAELLKNDPPIFLPYLTGERAPIFDAEATGAFLGITGRTTREDMAYAVCEGVAFSLLHIYESMGVRCDAPTVRVSGGASRLRLLTRIKAELLGKTFAVLSENDTSALGAVMAAGVGVGLFSSFVDAAEKCCGISETVEPSGEVREKLLTRYGIYQRIYPALKDEMHAFRAVKQ